MQIKFVIVQVETITTRNEKGISTDIIHTYMDMEGQDTPDLTEAYEHSTWQEAITACYQFQNHIDDNTIRYLPRPILAD